VQDQPFSTTALEEALDVEGAREILESFLEDTNGVVDRIEDSVLNRKQETLRSASHMLRGCCRVLGAEEAEKVSKTMEQSAVSGDWQTAEQQLPGLRTSFEKITAHVRRYLNGA
jgi:HPt (histidine-containing phosphotransfer) domain-containing protein